MLYFKESMQFVLHAKYGKTKLDGSLAAAGRCSHMAAGVQSYCALVSHCHGADRFGGHCQQLW